MNEPLRKTLVDAIGLLESRGAAYALIGGLAASVRGRPRVTVDVDLVIAADVNAALHIAGGLDATPFAPLFSDVTEVIERAFILPLRHRVTGVKVDIAIGASGFEQQLVARASDELIADRPIRTATAEDLVIMKSMAGRPRRSRHSRPARHPSRKL